jgi:hypothetical protein
MSGQGFGGHESWPLVQQSTCHLIYFCVLSSPIMYFYDAKAMFGNIQMVTGEIPTSMPLQCRLMIQTRDVRDLLIP